MSLREKVKALHIEKKRSFRIVLALELLLLLAGIPGLFGKNRVYEYGAEHMRGNFGVYREDLGGWYVDETMAQTGNPVDFVNISLPRGVYSVALHYTTDTNMTNRCTVTDGIIGYKSLLTNGEHLYSALHSTDFNMWLLEDSAGMIVHAVYEGQGCLTVTGLTISETNALNRIWIFCILLGSLAANGLYLYIQYDRQYNISQKDKTVTFGLGLIILFASLPLMLDYMINSGDLIYHLMRIEGIKDGLLSGQFPVRIAPEWQQGYGYASSVFYGETLLYIAALFRMTGFTVLTSYRLFFLIMTIAQVLIAYFCFQKMFGEKYTALLCAALYTLSVYRIYKTYVCGSFGESFGVLFLPFLAYGFWRVFTQDIVSREYKKSWVPLTIGFTGLIQSHFLTCELVGFFTIILCVIQWKKVFRRETFLALAKTVIYSCLLSAWFLVPFADYMLTGDFVIQHVSGRTIQERGLYPAHLLFAYSRDGANVFFDEGGMYDSHPTNIGIALIAVLILWLGLLFFRRTKELDKSALKLGKIAAAFGILSMCMSLSAFPWDRLQSISGITATLVSSIQFPNRVLTIANVSLVTLAGVVSNELLRHSRERYLMYCAGMTVLLLVSSGYLNTDLLYHAGSIRLYNEEGMGTGNIAGAEYLPYGTDASQLVHRPPVAEGSVTVEDWEKQGLTVTVTCENIGDREGLIDLPLLYYKGYRAGDLMTGESLEVCTGENLTVAVRVPVGYRGTVRISFQSPRYWRVAEAVSLLSFLGMAVSGALTRKHRREQTGAESRAA